MILNSIEISNLLSFGQVIKIDGFSRYNLFIGENGSGKTNCLRLISGEDIEYIKLNKSNHLSYTPSIPFKLANRHIHLTDIPCFLSLEYSHNSTEKNTSVNKVEFSSHRLNSSASILAQGNFEEYLSRVDFVHKCKSDLTFFKELTLKADNFHFSLLNYGLYYIFNKDYRFDKNGAFIQGDGLTTVPSGTQERDYQNLPSGVYECAKLLMPILLNRQKPIRLIDEPEKSLEPRILRRLFHYLVWLTSRKFQDKSIYEEEICNKVNMHFESNLSRFKRNSEEFIDKNEPNSILIRQLFISSHSPLLINEILKLNPNSSIYSFKKKIKSFNLKEEHKTFSDQAWTRLRHEPHRLEILLKEKTHFSDVKKLNTRKDCLDILENLGCQGSDILQTNGIIWVEGPSDIIYIKKWIELYSNEKKLPLPIQGINYEFQMYGGTLLDSLCLIKIGENEEEEYKKLVSIFSFSRNAFVIIDSDTIINTEGILVDKSKFQKAKQFIKIQFESLNSEEGNNLGLWYKEGNTQIRTIEDYLDDESKKIIKSTWTKKIAAQKVTESWKDDKKLVHFPNDLRDEIAILFDKINEWNK